MCSRDGDGSRVGDIRSLVEGLKESTVVVLDCG